MEIEDAIHERWFDMLAQRNIAVQSVPKFPSERFGIGAVFDFGMDDTAVDAELEKMLQALQNKANTHYVALSDMYADPLVFQYWQGTGLIIARTVLWQSTLIETAAR